jgi:hypothetical protein
MSITRSMATVNYHLIYCKIIQISLHLVEHPITLYTLHTFKEFVAIQRSVSAFLHQSILAALKASQNGVLARTFRGVHHERVNLAEPKYVAVVMKKRE